MCRLALIFQDRLSYAVNVVEHLFLMQITLPKRVYRPVLLERPSMTKFIVLSVLMHILAIVLLGDASDGANRVGRGDRDAGSGWASTFTAQLGRPAASLTSSAVAAVASSKATKQASSDAAKATQSRGENVQETTTATATNTIEPIPVIAVETANPVSNFVVPSLNIEPITAPQSTTTTNFAAILLPTEPAPVSKADDNFAIYVPPIIERARVETSDVQPAIAPLTSVAAPILATKEFVSTPIPAPVQTPAPTLVVTAVAPQVVTIAKPDAAAPPIPAAPVATIAPIAPIAPITPIEKIALPLTARREFAPALSTSIAPTGDETTVKTEAVVAPTSRANVGSTANDKSNLENAASGVSRGSATVLNPSASASSGGSDGLSSLLPIIPVKPITSNPLTLDLDKLRQRAREVAIEGSGPRMLLPFPTVAKPADKRDIEKIFDKALKRPDCKDEYADMGLAAVVPLVRDAIKGTGCKW